jgi:hypothetical protein
MLCQHLISVPIRGFHEPSVGPSLARRGCKPVIADRELLCELAKHRHLIRREIVHHALGIVGFGWI